MGLTEKLEELMKVRGLNKSQLAKESGVPYTTIDGLFKKGAENVKLSTLRKLSDYFDVSLDVLTDSNNTSENEETGYYLDKEAAKIAQEIYDNPNLRILFDTTRKVKPEDLKFIAEMVRRMSGEDND